MAKKEKLEIIGDFWNDSDVKFDIYETHFAYETHQILREHGPLLNTAPPRYSDEELKTRANPFVQLDPDIGVTRTGNITLGALEVEEYYPNGKEEADMELEVERRSIQSPLQHKRTFSLQVILD